MIRVRHGSRRAAPRRTRSGRRAGATTVMSAAAPARDGDDHVREDRPRVIEIVLRRPRRVVRDANGRSRAARARARVGALLGRAVVGRPHEEAAARTFLGGVRQRQRRRRRAPSRADAARRSTRADTSPRRARGSPSATPGRERARRHQFTPRRRSASSQKRSDRYFSPPSRKTVTMTPASSVAADLRAPRRARRRRDADEQALLAREPARQRVARPRCRRA